MCFQWFICSSSWQNTLWYTTHTLANYDMQNTHITHSTLWYNQYTSWYTDTCCGICTEHALIYDLTHLHVLWHCDTRCTQHILWYATKTTDGQIHTHWTQTDTVIHNKLTCKLTHSKWWGGKLNVDYIIAAKPSSVWIPNSFICNSHLHRASKLPLVLGIWD